MYITLTHFTYIDITNIYIYYTVYVNVLVSICVCPIFIIYTCIICLQLSIVQIYPVCIYWYISIGCIIFICVIYTCIDPSICLCLCHLHMSFWLKSQESTCFFRHLGPCFLSSAPTSCTLCNPWFICLFHGLPRMWGSFLIHRIRLSWTPDVPLLPGLSRKMDLGAPPRHWVFPWCSLAHQSCS